MPTNRKRTRRVNDRIELNGMVRVHVELGDCLIAGAGMGCGCGLRDYDGNEREDLVRVMKIRMEAEKNGDK
ncbi:MAG: hypothetical protein ACSLEZ_13060 [Thiobacillus sp.]